MFIQSGVPSAPPYENGVILAVSSWKANPRLEGGLSLLLEWLECGAIESYLSASLMSPMIAM